LSTKALKKWQKIICFKNNFSDRRFFFVIFFIMDVWHIIITVFVSIFILKYREMNFECYYILIRKIIHQIWNIWCINYIKKDNITKCKNIYTENKNILVKFSFYFVVKCNLVIFLTLLLGWLYIVSYLVIWNYIHKIVYKPHYERTHVKHGTSNCITKIHVTKSYNN
jgi:hypothetical protein